MTKKDGQKIVIQFTEKIISDVTTTSEAFNVSFKEYDMMPGGKLVDRNRPISKVEQYNSFIRSPDLSEAQLIDMQVDKGTLILGSE